MKAYFVFFILLIVHGVHSQHSVTGKLYDRGEETPLEGIHVYFENENTGTITDQNGEFEIVNPNPDISSLFCSSIGYRILEIEIESGKNMDLGIIYLERISYALSMLTISDLRVKENQPFAYSNMEKEDIEERNFAQDIPFLLKYLPSVVVSSDAGAGVGYTGLRIRGSDQSRINVTVNGIPYNDSESQQVYWVDLPDFSSSLENLQVQRGLGTSTNGAAAFGASVHLNTLEMQDSSSVYISNSFGSYGTRKHNVQFNTGVIQSKFKLNGRLSIIKSDGYIDRASSDLKSFYLDGAFISGKTILHALIFGGKEITYQSWYGTPESRIENDTEAMLGHAANNGFTDQQTQNLLNSGRTYNFYTYDDQNDDYQQDHYQLHFYRQMDSGWNFKVSLHATKGNGFFEEFRKDDQFSSYKLENPVINGLLVTSGDFVRRRWLDNDFFGFVWSLENSMNTSDLVLGGAFNRYSGDHYGELTWSEYGQDLSPGHRYYLNTGKKNDFNIFSKYDYQLNSSTNLYMDLQLRRINYNIAGTDNDLRNLNTEMDCLFFNPKLGVSYRFNSSTIAYASFGIGNREPDRNDFVDADAVLPKHETLRDLEIGVKFQNPFQFEINTYLMDYRNQLVLTGQLNDVGSPLRTNVPESYRLGVEFIWNNNLTNRLDWMGSVNFSKNKIQKFNEIIYDYTEDFDVLENQYSDVDISFSPDFTGSSQLTYRLTDFFTMQINTKYVCRQYLDNTQRIGRSLDPYLVNDLLINYANRSKSGMSYRIAILINNVFDELYESNGYTYSYVYGEMITENFYYPQAGRNFLVSFSVRL